MAIRAVLDQVNVVVDDMDAMAAFYGRLGLDLDGGSAAWQPHHRSSTLEEGVHLDLDSPTFAATWNRGWTGGAGVVLGFRVPTRDEVDELYAELVAAGHPGQQAPDDAFWGARYAVVTDPDGNAVGIMSPSEPTLRSRTPDPPQ